MTDERVVDVVGKQTVVIGVRGAGKSTWVQNALDRAQSHLVYDVCHEHDRFHRYLPDNRRGDEAIAELDGVLSRLVIDNDPDRRPKLVVVEEASRMVPNRGSVPDAIGELTDLGRHYERPGGTGVGMMYVTRRPAQIDTDVVEMADHLIVYRIRGKNDKDRLNREADGLGDAAATLENYEWLHVGPNRDYQRMSPVPEGDTTGSI